MKKIIKYNRIFSSAFALLAIMLFTTVGYGQTKDRSLVIMQMDKAEAMKYLMEFILKKGYFIQAFEVDPGFVQVHVLEKNKEMFNRNRRYKVNYIVDQPDINSCRIRIQANEEVQRSGGNGTGSFSYFHDEGTVKKEEVYESFVQELHQYYDAIGSD